MLSSDDFSFLRIIIDGSSKHLIKEIRPNLLSSISCTTSKSYSIWDILSSSFWLNIIYYKINILCEFNKQHYHYNNDDYRNCNENNWSGLPPPHYSLNFLCTFFKLISCLHHLVSLDLELREVLIVLNHFIKVLLYLYLNILYLLVRLRE